MRKVVSASSHITFAWQSGLLNLEKPFLSGKKRKRKVFNFLYGWMIILLCFAIQLREPNVYFSTVPWSQNSWKLYTMTDLKKYFLFTDQWDKKKKKKIINIPSNLHFCCSGFSINFFSFYNYQLFCKLWSDNIFNLSNQLYDPF